MLRIGMFTTLTAALLLSTATAQDAALEGLKRQADAAYQSRDFGKTIELADQILAKQATDHVALYLRGSARVEVGIVGRSPDLIRQGISDAREAIKHEGSGMPDYYLPYIYGMSYLTVIEGKPNHAQTARQVADSVLEREDLADDERANILYQRAYAQMQLKDFPSTEADLKQAIQLNPKLEAAYMLQAEVYALSKTPNEALAAYTQVVTVFNQDPVAYNNRGMFLLSHSQHQAALSDFTVATQLNPKFTEAHVNRGYAFMDAGDFANAEAALNQALAIDSKHTGALGLRGTCRMNLGRAAEGLQDYKTIVQLTPTSANSYSELGFAQFFAGDYPGANQSFARAMELDKNARFLLPWRLAAEVRAGTITQELYKATLSRPTEQRDWVDHLILYQGGRVDENALMAAVHPTDPKAKEAQTCEAYYFMGLEMMRRNRPAEARGYFTQATAKKMNKLSAFRGAQLSLRSSGATTN